MPEITKIRVDSIDYDVRDTSKLEKITYEYNKEVVAGASASTICIGKFPCATTNITVDIDMVSGSTVYQGTLVVAANGVNASAGGSVVAQVEGDAKNNLTSNIFYHYVSGSNVIPLYLTVPANARVALHIKCVSPASAPTSITTTENKPSSATKNPTRALSSASVNHASSADTATKIQNKTITFKNLVITDGSTTTTYSVACAN